MARIPASSLGASPKRHVEYLTVEEASEASGLSVATVRRRCANNEIEAIKVGSQWLVAPDAFTGLKPARRRRAPSSAKPKFDLNKALQHVQTTDLSELWVPDVLRQKETLANPAHVTEEARRRLEENSFRPAEIIEVPKTPFSNRPGALLDLPDRIAFQAVVGSIIAQIEERLSANVFSSRRSKGDKYFLEHGPSRWVRFKKAVKSAAKEVPEGAWVAKSDISAYFEHIRHDILMEELASLGVDGDALRALRTMLSKWASVAGIGLPQGPNASRVLGNFYLCQVDDAMEDAGYAYFRFMDDVRVVAASKEAAIAGLRNFERLCRARGLILSSAKSDVELLDTYVDEDDDPDADLAAYFFDLGRVHKAKPILKKIIKSALPKGEGAINVRRARFSIWRLARIRDNHALRYSILPNLESLAPVASAVAAYLKHFIGKPYVQSALADFLGDSSRSYSPFLRTWIFASMLEASSVTEAWRVLAEQDAKDKNNPVYLRSVALCVLGKARVPRDLVWMKREAEVEYDPNIVRAYLVALTYAKSLDKATVRAATAIHPTSASLGDWLRARKNLPSLVYPNQEIKL